MDNNNKKEALVSHAGLENTEKRFIKHLSRWFKGFSVFFKCRIEGLVENVMVQIATDLGLDRWSFKGTWNLLVNAIAEHNIQQKEKDIWHANG